MSGRRMRDVVDDPAIVKAAHLELDAARYAAASQALAVVGAELESHRPPPLLWRGAAYESAEAIRMAIPGPDAEAALARFAEAVAPYEARAELLGRHDLITAARRARKAWRHTYRRLARTPARSLLGLLAKLRALNRTFRAGAVGPDDAALWASTLADAERLILGPPV